MPIHSRANEGGSRKPVLLCILSLLIGLVPAYVIPPGPMGSAGSPIRLLGYLMLGLALVGLIASRRFADEVTINFGALLVVSFLMVFILLYGYGATFADPALSDQSLLTAQRLLTLVAAVGVCLFAMISLKDADQCSLVLGCLAIGLGFNCLVAIMADPERLQLLFKPPGFVINEPERQLDIATLRFGTKRAVGTTKHPIEFTVLAAVAVPLMIHFARYATHWQIRGLAGVGAVLAIAAVPEGVSRSGILALAVSMSVYIWSFSFRRLLVNGLFAVLVLGLLTVLRPRVIESLWQTITNSGNDPSVLVRIDRYAVAIESFRSNPFFGIGFGQILSPDRRIWDNQWLRVLVEGGLVGVFGMTCLAVAGLLGFAYSLRSAVNKRERGQAFAVGAMWFGVLSSSFTADIFGWPQLTLLLFLLTGLLWYRNRTVIAVVANRRHGLPTEEPPGFSRARAF